ncbi:hypothetical protein GOODEAATRI_015898 [Goodea atripinnis]|uniref:SMCHD1 Ig-like domain-containing protein n=1 Tax=Goodea atripinnis TaxID=208336 RepID=A0ABV0MI48_9TELE
MSEEGSPMATFNPADLSMWWWKGDSSSRPETISVNIVANRPVKLGPECQLLTRVVSYSKDIASRILVENIALKIMDQHGNPAGQDLNGKVLVSTKCPDGEPSRTLPLFEGKTRTIDFVLKEGSTYINVNNVLYQRNLSKPLVVFGCRLATLLLLVMMLLPGSSPGTCPETWTASSPGRQQKLRGSTVTNMADSRSWPSTAFLFKETGCREQDTVSHHIDPTGEPAQCQGQIWGHTEQGTTKR